MLATEFLTKEGDIALSVFVPTKHLFARLIEPQCKQGGFNLPFGAG